MEMLYSLQRRSPKRTNLKCLTGAVTLCTISSSNLIAFTTITELDDVVNKTWGSHVYVADLNTPWDARKVTDVDMHISALEWDLPGNLLLVCDVGGNLRIYSSPNHLVSHWVCVHTATFLGEHILAASFFHNGKKISLISEKKENALYNEKFSHLRFACSVRGFGGSPAEGALVVTATGLLGATLLTRPITNDVSNGPPVGIVTMESLAATRKHITAVDICYGKNGHFLIAVSGGSVQLPIQCYRVSVRKVDEKCIITSQALPSFFHRDFASGIAVSHLRWVTREDADSLVIGVQGTSGSSLQVWELREKTLPVHPLLAGPNGATETFNTVLWQFQSKFIYLSKLTSLSSSKLCISNSVSPPSYVIAAMADNTIHCLYRDSLKQVCSTKVNVVGSSEDGDRPQLAYVDTSWLGNVLLAIDTFGQTYLFRLQPIIEPGGPLSVANIVTLLEYCIVSGLDCMDLLLANARPPTLLEPACDRLTEGFNRQLAHTQQYYYIQFLYIKIALYRLTSQGQAKANDLTNLLMLHSIATAFKSLLRPSDMSSHDKSPADALAAVMTEAHTDVDKILMDLEAKEFTVEPSTLQSLQQLIQWVADLALNLLAKLPDQPRPSSVSMQPPQKSLNSGYELLRDLKALNTLRELLVIIRIWGLLRPTCLPVFVKSCETHDAFAHLFRLLSQLSQNPNEPEDSLLDECCQLPNQVKIPQLSQNCPRVALATPLLHQQSFPLQLEYGSEPDSLRYTGGGDSSTWPQRQVVDSIRYAYLGTMPARVRECARCGGKARAPLSRTTSGTSTQPPATPRALRAYEQRWLMSCKCGGPWTMKTLVN